MASYKVQNSCDTDFVTYIQEPGSPKPTKYNSDYFQAGWYFVFSCNNKTTMLLSVYNICFIYIVDLVLMPTVFLRLETGASS